MVWTLNQLESCVEVYGGVQRYTEVCVEVHGGVQRCTEVCMEVHRGVQRCWGKNQVFMLIRFLNTGI